MASTSQSRTNRFKEFAAESVNAEDYLDSAEQHEMIRKFVEQNDSSNAWFQNIITLAGLFFGLAKAYYMVSQLLFPWYLQPHALYVDTVPAEVVVLWELLSCLAFFAVALAMHPAFGLTVTIRRFLHVLAGGSYIVFFLTWFLYRGFDVGPELLWFVFGNLAVQGLGLYAEYLIAESSRQIDALRGSQYQYNKP